MKFITELKKHLKNSYEPLKLEGVEDAREFYSLEKYENMLKQARFLSTSDLMVFTKTGPKNLDALTTPIPFYHMNSHPDKVCNHRLFKNYKAGEIGIKVKSMTDFSPEMRQLQSDLVRQTGSRFSINSYYSYAEQKKPLLLSHKDSYNVLTLQIYGKKRFFFGSRCDDDKATDKTSILVEEGEMLFIPEGVRHYAMPEDGPSLHLTLGEYPITLYDYLAFVTNHQKVCNEILQASLPLKRFDEIDKEALAPITEAIMGSVTEFMKSPAQAEKFLEFVHKDLLPK